MHRGRAEEKQSGRGSGDSCARGIHADASDTGVTEFGIQGYAATGAVSLLECRRRQMFGIFRASRKRVQIFFVDREPIRFTDTQILCRRLFSERVFALLSSDFNTILTRFAVKLKTAAKLTS